MASRCCFNARLAFKPSASPAASSILLIRSAAIHARAPLRSIQRLGNLASRREFGNSIQTRYTTKLTKNQESVRRASGERGATAVLIFEGNKSYNRSRFFRSILAVSFISIPTIMWANSEIKCESNVSEAFPTLEQVEKDSQAFQTREEYLLSISEDMTEQQHERKIPQRSYFRRIYSFMENIYDSIATWVRFVHLVVIFVPVVLTAPVILFGSKVSDSDTETTGALWWYRLLIHSMERAGATFIKLGQWAASRTDIFPHKFCVEMSKLHSSVQKHPLSITIDAIEEAFKGQKFEDIFEEFEKEPLGIGAIAQVSFIVYLPLIIAFRIFNLCNRCIVQNYHQKS